MLFPACRGLPLYNMVLGFGNLNNLATEMPPCWFTKDVNVGSSSYAEYAL